AGHRGRIIKTLGDSVLFLGGSAEESVEVALDIVAVIGGDSRLPDVRVGLASGPVVLRMGDVYGPAVNLAARLTAVARRNRVIVDQRTAALLPVEQFETRVLPARPVRGFGDIEPVAVRRTRSPHDF
ncbi:MAG: adenylate/guanylate cyclase domain-containing protein, partial [Actinomycetota bacterium]|nr:adenylate/guanylate cyclase domain-containing protein [Actinomycetota bacterium]